MVFGIGTDIVELARIEKTYNRFGKHFVERLLMPEENTLFYKNKNPIRFLAMRFAAKESIVKSMGTGFSDGIWIRDIGIINKDSGKPIVVYSSRGDQMRQKLGISEIHISLTDEAGLVLAFSVAIKSDNNL